MPKGLKLGLGLLTRGFCLLTFLVLALAAFPRTMTWGRSSRGGVACQRATALGELPFGTCRRVGTAAVDRAPLVPRPALSYSLSERAVEASLPPSKQINLPESATRRKALSGQRITLNGK